MGILNVTPDSFSDGGRWNAPELALAHAEDLLAQGAHIIDVGGESTRPGSQRITEDEEWQRIGRVVETLASRGVVVSVDTIHALTARRAADAGAAIINDVSGGLWDPQMNAVIAQTGAAYVIQHFRALPGPNESHDYGNDTVTTVLRELHAQVEAARESGVRPGQIIVDPGLGFSKTSEQSWELVDSFGTLRGLGYPVLIGASRKRFVASTGRDPDAVTAEISARCAREGIWAVRVHDVGLNVRTIDANEE
ncbi:dihydropteroate synthase [Schaalia sp. ZJ405]|uniref:dihydropteroate synthase n=1 Tax=Schaalia sp. ZJ405 TaxID=2709403 RepID=UPI0013EBEA0D|nr:dihydropteroate synthase [Schaalia sp. ZJ405]QPK82158.1 dihydropteroate synthase [Schaalia sp. ZJ405]